MQGSRLVNLFLWRLFTTTGFEDYQTMWQYRLYERAGLKGHVLPEILMDLVLYLKV